VSGEGHERVSVSTRPRICVVSLTDLSERQILVGEWMDADREVDDLKRRIEAMLARSPSSGDLEWGIWDYDGFAGLPISEAEPLETVSCLAKGIRAHGAAFAAWAELTCRSLDGLAGFDAAYLGVYETTSDYAARVLGAAELRDVARRAVPNDLAAYVSIDLEGFARDLELYGKIAVVDRPGGGVWVFAREH
jgi:antirestriction protein